MLVAFKVLLALASAAAVTSQAVPPTSDPFYAVPANIATYSLGTVVANRIRQVNTNVMDIPNNLKQAYQIFYRTTRTGSIADGTVATVFVPTNPKVPAKIFVYSTAEYSTNLDCAPSWAFVNNSNSTNAELVKFEGSSAVSDALNRGYYVVTPDALGSKSGWVAGHTEGWATLDAVRAIIKQWNLPSNAAVALYGYSGGAHTTVWASSVAASYAPDLNIVGAAYGGTPVDLRAAVALINKSPNAWLAGAGFFGLANAYPTLNQYFESQYNAFGRANATLFRTPGYCAGNSKSPGTDYLRMFNTDVLAPGTLFSTIIDNESLLSTSSKLPIAVPKFPRYQYHGQVDDIVPFAPAQQYVDEQCAKAADIAFEVVPIANHVGAALVNFGRAKNFAFAALDGTLAPITCGKPYTG
jgi:hypothetical protein